MAEQSLQPNAPHAAVNPTFKTMSNTVTETAFYAIRRRNTSDLVRVMMSGFGGEARLTMAPAMPVFQAEDLMNLAEVLEEPVPAWMSSARRPALGELTRDVLEAVKVSTVETSSQESFHAEGAGVQDVLVTRTEKRIESVEHLLPDTRALKEITRARRIPAKVATHYVKDCAPPPALLSEVALNFRLVLLPDDVSLEQAMQNWPGQMRYFQWEKAEILAVAPIPEDYRDMIVPPHTGALVLTK